MTEPGGEHDELDDELDGLIHRADLDGLVRMIDDRTTAHEWAGLLRVRDRCRRAVDTGRQLWPAATLAEHRLALLAPPEFVAVVLDESDGVSGRFTIGPLTEVAAQHHGWNELVGHLDRGPRAAFVAHERSIRGERIPVDDVIHGSTSSRTARWTSGSSSRSASPGVSISFHRSGRSGRGNSAPWSVYVASGYVGSHGRAVTGISSTGGNVAASSSEMSSPRNAHSCATNAARGPRRRCGSRSAQRWCCAATSVSGPIVKRPDMPSLSSRTVPTYSPGASSASRNSASVAAGQSCRPVSTARRDRSRTRSRPAPSRLDVRSSMVRTRASRSARWMSSSSSSSAVWSAPTRSSSAALIAAS